MQVKPIKNDGDHDHALQEIEKLWGAATGTPQRDKLEVLITLVEAYEDRRFPITRPDPIEAIKFRLEQEGKDYRSLIGILGQRSRVYEVMRRDRPLSLAMIRRLHEALHIPAEVLLAPSKLRKRPEKHRHPAVKSAGAKRRRRTA